MTNQPPATPEPSTPSPDDREPQEPPSFWTMATTSTVRHFATLAAGLLWAHFHLDKTLQGDFIQGFVDSSPLIAALGWSLMQKRQFVHYVGKPNG